MKRMTIAIALVVAPLSGVAAAQTQPRPTTAAPAAPQRPAAPAQAPAAPAAPRPAAAAPAAPAAPLVFPADSKVGFLNMQVIINDSKLGKAGQERMQALSERKQLELTAKNREIQAKQTEIQAGQNVLTNAVLNQKNAELTKLQSEAQFLNQQAQTEIQTLQDQLIEEFQEKVLPIVEEIRKERNLWVVFSLGDGTGVAAVNPNLDLSTEVDKRLDAPK